MKSFPRRLGLAVLAVFLLSSVVFAVDIPLGNWTVPPYHAGSSSGGITTMGEVTQAIPFIGIDPCRLVDTRTTTSPNFPAPYGPPVLGAGAPRTFDLNSDPKCTGFPPDGFVQAYSLNITVTNTQGPGFILIYPQGGAQPTVSTLNYVAGQTVANAAIVPAGPTGGVTVVAGVSGTDLIIDINGYFTEQTGNSTNYFYWQSPNPGTFGAARIANTDTGTGTRYGLTARASATGNGTSALHGQALGAGGYIFGVKGLTSSAYADSAGVKGVSGNGDPLGDDTDCAPCYTAGVRGVNNVGTGYGVLGITRDRAAVAGVLLGNTGTGVSMSGYLGADFGFATVGPDWGVFAEGDIGATGNKYFVEPHPTDASKIIRYIALEGAEAGTFFRGKGKFQNGAATIAVPEDFRMVTDPEGLSIQVTPIGEMATVAVVRIGLEGIVVKGSRNVEFFYTVNGVRATFNDPHPIIAGAEFMPRKAEATIPSHLSAGQKRILIQNGTYKPDGTVNMETARRLGWDKVWEAEAQSRPQPQPAPDTP